MKEEKYHMAFDKYEHGVLIKSLNKQRTELLEEGRPTDVVDELIVKAADAPKKKFKVVEKPCKCDEAR